jgi:hypothetical protein
MRSYEEFPDQRSSEFSREVSRDEREFSEDEGEVVQFTSNRFRPSSRAEIAPALEDDTLVDMRQRWNEIQSAFVDSPRETVAEADKLIKASIERVTAVLMNDRSRLESQWNRDGEVSTEDLRLALQQYRRCFDRLMSFKLDNG